MDHDAAHRLTHTGSADRRLALEIRSWKFGFAVLEGTTLLDWGVCRFPAGGIAVAIRKFAFLLKICAPSVVITRRTRRAEHRSSKGAARLAWELRRELARRSVRFVVLARRDVREFFALRGYGKKDEIAVAVADTFGQLKPRLSRPRKPWDPERNIVAVFDAVATAIAFEGLREPVADP